jgi:hypothetical protein
MGYFDCDNPNPFIMSLPVIKKIATKRLVTPQQMTDPFVAMILSHVKKKKKKKKRNVDIF